ncbi:Hypothetical protein BSM4216_3276 [Bacillus smithii]|nr:Hypothetical protein BSM4216_3276 [Bacillus smithii]
MKLRYERFDDMNQYEDFIQKKPLTIGTFIYVLFLLL